MLEKGRIFAAGDPATLLTPETIAAVYQVEVEVGTVRNRPHIVPLRPLSITRIAIYGAVGLAGDVSVMESRLQAELWANAGRAEFKYKGDVWADGVAERIEYDTREACFFARPSDMLDIKIGRQVLTWGTGELVFLNDLFPKDWRSYFIGRNELVSSDKPDRWFRDDELAVRVYKNIGNYELALYG